MHSDGVEVRNLFDELSGDNEFISIEQVGNLLRNFYDMRDVPQSKVDRFMQRLDMNDDGEVTWEEFQYGVSQLFTSARYTYDDEIGVPRYAKGVPLDGNPDSRIATTARSPQFFLR